MTSSIPKVKVEVSASSVLATPEQQSKGSSVADALVNIVVEWVQEAEVTMQRGSLAIAGISACNCEVGVSFKASGWLRDTEAWTNLTTTFGPDAAAKIAGLPA